MDPSQNDNQAHRSFSKLKYNPEAARNERRLGTQESQKKNRSSLIEMIRKLEAEESGSEIEDFGEFPLMERTRKVNYDTISEEADELNNVVKNETKENQEMDVVPSTKNNRRDRRNKHYKEYAYKRSNKKRSMSIEIMLSEWLIERPENFADWIGVICPVGKRCLVLAARSKTIVFSRKGDSMGAFMSLLPGGGKYYYNNTTSNRIKGVTILDCFWIAEINTFYVLDLICWNSFIFTENDIALRDHMLQNKFVDNPELSVKEPNNPFRFLPLPKFNVGQDFESVLTRPPIFDGQVDGVLFFAPQYPYTGGTSEFCKWVYLIDIQRRLQLYVCPELLALQRLKGLKKSKGLGERGNQEEDEGIQG